MTHITLDPISLDCVHAISIDPVSGEPASVVSVDMAYSADKQIVIRRNEKINMSRLVVDGIAHKLMAWCGGDVERAEQLVFAALHKIKSGKVTTKSYLN